MLCYNADYEASWAPRLACIPKSHRNKIRLTQCRSQHVNSYETTQNISNYTQVLGYHLFIGNSSSTENVQTWHSPSSPRFQYTRTFQYTRKINLFRRIVRKCYIVETNSVWSWTAVVVLSLEFCVIFKGPSIRTSLWSLWYSGSCACSASSSSLDFLQRSTNGINEATTKAPPVMWNAGPYEPSLSAARPAIGIVQWSEFSESVILNWRL